MHETSQKRSDIQGLRAWAVLLVVCGHLFPEFLPGGFIGVDIFFIISGYVITQQMSRLRVEYPHSFLRNFYTRRIRRILPSALFVILISLFATHYYLGIVAENDFKGSAGWVTIFLGNFHFQSESLNYFSSGIVIQPLQHFWSLSIEEQFYLIWPALFLALWLIFKKERALVIALTAFAVLSLSYSIYSSEALKGSLFFNSFARVWELALGALLYLYPRRFKFLLLLETLVLALLLISAFTISPSMQWPRLTAIPVAALTAYLLLREENGGVSILKLAPMQFIGELSYLIYLWHWPILIIVKSTRLQYDHTSVVIILILTSLASLFTHYAIEKPLRRSEFLLKRPILTISGAISSIALASGYFFLTYKG